MAPFAHALGYEGPPFGWNEDRRALQRAELDAWYARAYGLTRDELRYILDPAEVVGDNYPSETFRGLKKNDIAQFGSANFGDDSPIQISANEGTYRTARLVLDAWDRMAAGENLASEIVASRPTMPAVPSAPDLGSLPDNAWAYEGQDSAAILAQLAALIKALPGPTPKNHIRLAALYALHPRYLTSHLSAADGDLWCRLVGNVARTPSGNNLAAFAPRMSAGWRDAVTQMLGMRAIIEDVAAQTWSAGPTIDEFRIDQNAWPFGRASFVLSQLADMRDEDLTVDLPEADRIWVNERAAA